MLERNRFAGSETEKEAENMPTPLLHVVFEIRYSGV